MAQTSGSWRFSHSSLVIVKLGTCTQHAHSVAPRTCVAASQRSKHHGAAIGVRKALCLCACRSAVLGDKPHVCVSLCELPLLTTVYPSAFDSSAASGADSVSHHSCSAQSHGTHRQNRASSGRGTVGCLSLTAAHDRASWGCAHMCVALSLTWLSCGRAHPPLQAAAPCPVRPTPPCRAAGRSRPRHAHGRRPPETAPALLP